LAAFGGNLHIKFVCGDFGSLFIHKNAVRLQGIIRGFMADILHHWASLQPAKNTPDFNPK
jgi:hypothetical protein